MTWMITATGQDFHLSGAASLINKISLQDIAHALAQINRYTGHTSRPYSVAEHSLLVAEIAKHAGATPMLQLAALLHDAHEAYTGDVSSPVKWALGSTWSAFERTFEVGVRRHFGLGSTFASQGRHIRHYDLVALATERRDLTAFDSQHNAPWHVLHGIESAPWVNLNSTQHTSMTWANWRDRFAERVTTLQAECKAWLATQMTQAAEQAQEMAAATTPQA